MFLSQFTDRDVLLFIDVSSLTNPGTTLSGSVVYIKCYNGGCFCPHEERVNNLRNNYTGELVGIQIGSECLTAFDYFMDILV